MTTPIAEDFPAIHARLVAIRAAEQSPDTNPQPSPVAPVTAGPADFHGWLMATSR